MKAPLLKVEAQRRDFPAAEIHELKYTPSERDRHRDRRIERDSPLIDHQPQRAAERHLGAGKEDCRLRASSRVGLGSRSAAIGTFRQ